MTKTTGEDWVGGSTLAREMGVTIRTVYSYSTPATSRPASSVGSSGSSGPTSTHVLERGEVKPRELAHLYPPGEYGGPPRKR